MSDKAVPFEYMEYGIDAGPAHTFQYLFPVLERLLAPLPKGSRLIDIGCGHGHFSAAVARLGYDVIGVDLSESGIKAARKQHAGVRFEVQTADADLLQSLGVAAFDALISTEVLEHLYSPRPFMRSCFDALRPGGLAIFSTPYNGWLKNVAIAAAGKYDQHHDPLWDGGHIKFWSRRTLGRLMTETGFTDIGFAGAGRAPYLWMSMFMSGSRPA